MKNSKNLFSARSVLMFGLLATLGFSLSWNPEHFTMSRYEIASGDHGSGFIELASRDPAETTPANVPKTAVVQTKADEAIDLGEYSGDFKGAELHIIEKSGDKVRYYVKDKNSKEPVLKAGTWEKILEVKFDDKTLGNQNLLKHALAKEALKALKDELLPVASAESKAAPKERFQRKKSAPELANVCDKAYDEDQLDCESSEMIKLTEACSSSGLAFAPVKEGESKRERAKSARDHCEKMAKVYYDKYLKKTLQEGLKASKDSSFYEKALETRKELLANLPEKYGDAIRKDILRSSVVGILERSNEVFNAAMNQSNNNEQASRMHQRNAIATELYGYNGVGQTICKALVDRDCGPALSNPYNRGMMGERFQFYANYFERPLETILKNNNLGQGTNSVLSSIYGVDNTDPAVADILNARIGAANRTNAAPIPGQPTLMQNGLPASQGQILVPGSRPGGIVGQQQPNMFPQTMVPGQPFNGISGNAYNPMAPVPNYNYNNGLNGLNGINSAYPRSPGQRW